jgi:cyclase
MKTAVTALFFLFFGILATAQERDPEPVTLEKVTGNIFQILGGRGANNGLFIGENGVLVIDSKMDEASVRQTLEAIQQLTDKPIRYLVNTHSDGDHIMGNRFFPPSVVFVAHENCREDFFKENFGRESDWVEPEYYPFTPSLTFKEQMNIWLGKEQVELHYFGTGHTTGDIVVYFPDEKVALIGDLYFNDRPQLIHSNKNGNTFEYVKTMTRLLETLDADTFLSGHSGPVDRSAIEENMQLMVERQEKVKHLIGQDDNLEEILASFREDESRLVTSIYNELTGN